MPKLTPLSSRGVIKKLRKLWWKGPISWGKHSHMEKGNKIIPIPIHWWIDIWVGLINEIIKEAETTREIRINL